VRWSTALQNLKTMLIPGKYGLERWSYTLQRVSGVVVSLYFIAHVLETGSFVGGVTVWAIPDYDFAERAYREAVSFLKNPIFDAGLAVIGLLVVFHTINGVRLVLAHFGLVLGSPRRREILETPASFSNRQRALFWLSISLAIFAMLYTLDALMGVFRP